MTLPWLKEIPYQMNLFGPVCPFCGETKKYLVATLFREGIGWICEDCRKCETTKDMYVPPGLKEFKRRVRKHAGTEVSGIRQ